MRQKACSWICALLILAGSMAFAEENTADTPAEPESKSYTLIIPSGLGGPANGSMTSSNGPIVGLIFPEGGERTTEHAMEAAEELPLAAGRRKLSVTAPSETFLVRYQTQESEYVYYYLDAVQSFGRQWQEVNVRLDFTREDARHFSAEYPVYDRYMIWVYAGGVGILFHGDVDLRTLTVPFPLHNENPVFQVKIETPDGRVVELMNTLLADAPRATLLEAPELGFSPIGCEIWWNKAVS